MIHDLIGKPITTWYLRNLETEVDAVTPDLKIHRLYYNAENGEDVSFKTNFQNKINLEFDPSFLKDIQHSYFFDEDTLTTQEKYVFILAGGNQISAEWDVHYKNKDHVHAVDYEEVK